MAHLLEKGIEMKQIPQEAEELIDLCESDFETDVFQRLSKLGYRVTPQVAVG
ncbi:MAG: hypothetical protein IH899_01790, partial [Planctomycetes bacterium]|nr:hypothetical protein [Planctomycetota bacterium]